MLRSICLETNKTFWLERQRPKRWKTYGRAAKNPFGNPKSRPSPREAFKCVDFNGYGAKPKGMGASAQNMKNIRTRHKKTCEKIGTFFKKRNMECIKRERRKQERRLKKEKGKKKRKRVSAACEQILATCKI